MLVWRCDFCHKEGGIKKAWVSYQPLSSNNVEVFDMCEDCGKKFEEFLETLKKEN